MYPSSLRYKGSILYRCWEQHCNESLYQLLLNDYGKIELSRGIDEPR